MKLLVFSDVHKNKARLLTILDKHNDVDLTISLGDSELKSEFLESRDIIAIKGNALFDPGFTNEHTIDIEGKRILLTHGHKYRVQNGIDKLYYKALEVQANIAFYGHTHIAAFDKVEGHLFINPGSVNNARSSTAESYMTIHIQTSEWIFNWYDAKNHALLREITHEF